VAYPLSLDSVILVKNRELTKGDERELQQCLKEIRDYQQAHADLKLAHNFLFDLPIRGRTMRADVIVMGVNPGEAKRHTMEGSLHEESREHDFHEEPKGRGRASLRWSKLVLDHSFGRPVVQSEFFLWSSRNLSAEFQQRYGSLSQSQHLIFCRKQNLRLLAVHQPRIILCPGFGALDLFAAEMYSLNRVCVKRTDRGHRLIAHYERDGIPWVFTKHWTGARGFTQEQRNAIKAYIGNILGHPAPTAVGGKHGAG